jgi:ribose transport system substrate-binding protein
MKKLLIIHIFLISIFLLYLYEYHFRESPSSPISQMEESLRGEISEKYVMVTFQAGIDYWKMPLKGFEDAARGLNVSVEYRGATQYDAHEQITVLEQVIAKKPSGIAISAINPDKLTATINKAIDADIPVILFDADAPSSRAYSFVGTNNYNAGMTAAHKMAELLGESGKVAIVTLPHQLNHQERTKGFLETITKEYPEMEVIAIKDGKGDQLFSRQMVVDILRENPDLAGVFATEANGGVGIGNAIQSVKMQEEIKIISFDTDKRTLDMVREGIIAATLAQGTWKMGYWSLQFLFHLNHKLNPSSAEGISDMNLLPPYMDTGISIVTEENVENYYSQ